MSTFRHTDLISLREYTREDLALIWETAWDLKRLTKRGQRPDLLRNKTLAMVFKLIQSDKRGGSVSRVSILSAK